MHKTIVVLLLSICLFWYACGSSTEEQKKGPVDAVALFSSQCSMCHDMHEDKIGPALAGVQARWGNDTAKLKSFIKNNQILIQSGDPYAKALYEKWHQSAMPIFTQLSDAELNALLAYFPQ
jgi:cytochrome c551/c552